MLKSKVKQIVVFSISILFLVALIVFIINKYNQLKLENEILNALNNDIQYDYITDSEMLGHKYAKIKNPKQYEITSIINNYIENINICIKNHIGDKAKYELVSYELVDHSLSVHGIKEDALKSIYNLITKEDIEKYENGEINNYLVSKLQDKLKYKYDNYNLKWFIDNDGDKTIELPYNTYIKFIHSNKISFDVKNIRKVKFVNKKGYNCIVEYEKNDGSIEKKNIYVFRKNNNKEIMITSFNDIYYSETQGASLTFGQHDYDEEERRKNRISEETPQKVWSEEETGIHEEKKYIFDGSAFILLMHYLDTDKWEYRFRMFNPDKKGHVRGFDLPYKDKMTIDEAIEKFLSDKKLVKKALALWNIDMDKIGEDEIVDKIKENTMKGFIK